MDYLIDLHKIEKALSILDNTSYDTIEEANSCLVQYDKLKDEIILIIRQVLDDSKIPDLIKDSVYNRAIQLLTNHIGSVDDILKYGSLVEAFYDEGKITKKQLILFHEKLDIGRWR